MPAPGCKTEQLCQPHLSVYSAPRQKSLSTAGWVVLLGRWGHTVVCVAVDVEFLYFQIKSLLSLHGPWKLHAPMEFCQVVLSPWSKCCLHLTGLGDKARFCAIVWQGLGALHTNYNTLLSLSS